MILADSINFPLVAGLGLITLGPLILLETVIETLVFRVYLKTGFRAVFLRVLTANILSTLAGGLVLMFQDGIIALTGIHDSIPAFVRGYRWVGPLLILIYFAKSVLIEGLWLTRRRFLERVGQRAGGVLCAVFIGNVLSYLAVGPLFYYTTRPHFAGVETTFDASWTANPDVIVYYVDRDDKHVKRARLDGRDVKTLIPYPAFTFLVSEDESAFAYVDEGGNLFAYRTGDKEPVLLGKYEDGCFLTSVSISPDNRRVAFLEPPTAQSLLSGEDTRQALKIMNLDTHEVMTAGDVTADGWGSAIAWSSDGKNIYSLRVRFSQGISETIISAFNPDPPFGQREQPATRPRPADLVVNYLRAQGNRAHSGGHAMIPLRRHVKLNQYQVEVWPYLGSAVIVRQADRQVLFLQNEYGMLNLGLPPAEGAVALPSGDELLVEWWGQVYLLNPEARKLGLAINGDQFVPRTPEFRVTFEPDSRPD